MPIYTFLMEYAGGTYVSQVKAASPKSACLKWAKSLDVSQINGMRERSKQALLKQMKEEAPLPLDGLLNAWCTTAYLRKGLVLINLVKTENEKR
jgi:hypothetical protein